jgi:hypothetical protein
MQSTSNNQSIILETLQKQVVREVFSAVVPHGVRRTIPDDHTVVFDSSLIWWVVSGSATLEYHQKQLLSVHSDDILGPWFASVSPLRIGASGSCQCELLGFRQDFIWKIVSASAPKMRLWTQLQMAMCNKFFSEFAEFQATSVAPSPQYRHFAPGETIIIEGQEGNEVFVLTDGAAEVSVRGDRVGEIHQDEVFGALAALTEGVRTATVVATKPCDCMVFPKQEFRELLRTNPNLMEKLFRDVARALHNLNDSVVKAHHTKWQNLF